MFKRTFSAEGRKRVNSRNRRRLLESEEEEIGVGEVVRRKLYCVTNRIRFPALKSEVTKSTASGIENVAVGHAKVVDGDSAQGRRQKEGGNREGAGQADGSWTGGTARDYGGTHDRAEPNGCDNREGHISRNSISGPTLAWDRAATRALNTAASIIGLPTASTCHQSTGISEILESDTGGNGLGSRDVAHRNFAHVCRDVGREVVFDVLDSQAVHADTTAGSAGLQSRSVWRTDEMRAGSDIAHAGNLLPVVVKGLRSERDFSSGEWRIEEWMDGVPKILAEEDQKSDIFYTPSSSPRASGLPTRTGSGFLCLPTARKPSGFPDTRTYQNGKSDMFPAAPLYPGCPNVEYKSATVTCCIPQARRPSGMPGKASASVTDTAPSQDQNEEHPFALTGGKGTFPKTTSVARSESTEYSIYHDAAPIVSNEVVSYLEVGPRIAIVSYTSSEYSTHSSLDLQPWHQGSSAVLVPRRRDLEDGRRSGCSSLNFGNPHERFAKRDVSGTGVLPVPTKPEEVHDYANEMTERLRLSRDRMYDIAMLACEGDLEAWWFDLAHGIFGLACNLHQMVKTFQAGFFDTTSQCVDLSNSLQAFFSCSADTETTAAGLLKRNGFKLRIEEISRYPQRCRDERALMNSFCFCLVEFATIAEVAGIRTEDSEHSWLETLNSVIEMVDMIAEKCEMAQDIKEQHLRSRPGEKLQEVDFVRDTERQTWMHLMGLKESMYELGAEIASDARVMQFVESAEENRGSWDKVVRTLEELRGWNGVGGDLDERMRVWGF